jgi:hypothetical protein
MINGCDVTLRIGFRGDEYDVPFVSRTVRDRWAVLKEEAGIEGGYVCKSLNMRTGTTGGFTTPVTLETARLLLTLMFGSIDGGVFVTETRGLYRYQLQMKPAGLTECFSIIEEWGMNRKVYPEVVVKSFELRVHREENIMVHFDIDGDTKSVMTQRVVEKACYHSPAPERFNENGNVYTIDGITCNSIYAITLSCDKTNSLKTQIVLHRILESDELPVHINEFTGCFMLFRDKYEAREFGRFSMTLRGLDLVSDETIVSSADAVIGPLRYWVSGGVTAECFGEGPA